MRETADDLDRLQARLDASRSSAGAHLRQAFGESTSSSAEVAQALDGIFEMHLAVVTSAGAPLVAPIDGLLFHGQIWFGLPAGSLRATLVRRDPRVSASYTKDGTAFIVHGDARELDEDSQLAVEYGELVRELYVALYGPGWLDWHTAQRARAEPGAAFTGWIEPRRFYAKT